MPVQSDSKKGSQRPDRIGTRIRARSAPQAPGTEIASPEQPVGAIILPIILPGAASRSDLRLVVEELQSRGFATLVAELLSPTEAAHGYHNFDFDLMADRIADVTGDLRRKAPFEDLPIGYFGTNTGAAAVAIAAARPDCPAGALVMCHARPELASIELPRVHAPTLFIVEDDELAVDRNRSALAKLRCRGDLAILRDSGERLAAPKIAPEAARLAGDWFETHLLSRQNS